MGQLQAGRPTPPPAPRDDHDQDHNHDAAGTWSPEQVAALTQLRDDLARTTTETTAQRMRRVAAAIQREAKR
jgi:hypothetical protein